MNLYEHQKREAIERCKKGGKLTPDESANLFFSIDEMIEAGLFTEPLSESTAKKAAKYALEGKSNFITTRNLR